MDQFAKINRKSLLRSILILSAILWSSHNSFSAIAQKTTDKQGSAEQSGASVAGRYQAVGAFADRKIKESSGVVMASKFPGETLSALWTFNDSGGKPLLYRVDFDGKTQVKVGLGKNRDWESMCAFTRGQQRYLAVGDVGDNQRKRDQCQIYVMQEPAFPAFKKSVFQTIKFKYEDGPRDCEAIGYNQHDNSFWLVEKVYFNDKKKSVPGIYRLADPFAVKAAEGIGKDAKAKKTLVAKRIANFGLRNVTGMEFSPDGNKLIVRGYLAGQLFHKPKGKSWLETVKSQKATSIAFPLQSQGEAVCFTNDSQSLILTSEQLKATIWKIKLPPAKVGE